MNGLAHFRPGFPFTIDLIVTCALLITLTSPLQGADEEKSKSPVDATIELELISDDFGLADGPAWDGRGNLYVPDVKQSLIRRYNFWQKKWQTIHKSEDRYSASFFNHGKLFLSNNSGTKIEVLGQSGPETFFTIDTATPATKRPNDLVVDHSGGVYFTLTRQNQVIYVAPSGESMVVSEEVISPNGITLSPDEQTLYVAAYRPKKIIAIDMKSSGVADKHGEFATMDDGEALGADGMCIDRAGNVYCAGATDVWIWNPAGKLLDKVACPTRPINCTFGDQDMRSLYITGFGGVYRQRMRICGRSAHPSSVEPETSSTTTPSTAIPANITAKLDVVYAEYGPRRLLADIFIPEEGGSAKPAVVVVHGGGWLNGDKTKFRALAIRLAEKGFVTAAIEYRLGGESHFPAGIHDCNAAVRYLRANSKDLQIDPDRIAAVGGSAGGHLVGLMATGDEFEALQGTGGNTNQSSKLQAAVVMAGPMQIASGSVADRSRSGSKGSNAINWIGSTIDDAPEMYDLADAYEKISTKTCPILFMTGENDNPERNAPSREELKAAGVTTELMIYKDGNHGCWNRLPWFDQMSDDMAEWLHERLK